jgi:hypothetical protein
MAEGQVVALPEPVIGLSLNVPLQNAANDVQVQTLVFQTHVPASATEEQINAILDLAHRVTTRQGQLREVAMLKEHYRLASKRIQSAKESLVDVQARIEQEAIISGRRSAMPKGADKANVDNLTREIKKMQADCEEINARALALEEKINAPPSSANSVEGVSHK